MEHLKGQLSRGEWVVNVCNHFWWHYVYLFSLVIKGGQWILCWIDAEKFPDWKMNHTVRFKDGHVIEMLANGKNTHERVEDWLGKQKRTLKIYRTLVPFQDTPDLPYDFWGLPQKMLSYFRKYILRTGHTWNGRDGVPKGRDGFDCIEEVMTSIGEPDAHIWLPCRLPLCQKLEYAGTLETEPINVNKMDNLTKIALSAITLVLVVPGLLLIYYTPKEGGGWLLAFAGFLYCVVVYKHLTKSPGK